MTRRFLLSLVLLASPATRVTGHCRQGTGASMISAVVDDGSQDRPSNGAPEPGS